jgi:hypothetical protein
MTLSDITNIRLTNQQLTGTSFKTPKEIAGWMGAMQAQDYGMSKWALGVRLPNSTDKMIQSAIDKGEIIRTHLLRPTWHLVSADDIYWMLELSGPRVKAFIKPRIRQLEIADELFSKSNHIIEKALAGNNHLTREELVTIIQQAKINTDDLRGLHFLMNAELEGIIGSGITRNKNQTYALLHERVAKSVSLNKDEALAKLAKTYFQSHGPATLADFTWWSGLAAIEARHALEMVKSAFVSETIGTQTYWMSNSISIERNTKTAFLLPAFDEFLISYKDRSAAIALDKQSKAFTNNGIFKPVIVENGQVSGTWKRTVKKDKVIIEINHFRAQSEASKKRIEKAAKLYGDFLGKKVEIL